MKNVFVEGKEAAVRGVSHMDNPYSFNTDDHEMWAKGWLVGDDPVVWGHLSPAPVYFESDGALVALLAEMMQLPNETPWESGRQASGNGCVLSDNPYDPETVDKAEWDRGFVHGSLQDVKQIDQEESLALPGLPTVQVVPTRAFWALLNNIQIARWYSTEDLAKYVGIDQDRLVAGMIEFGLYDEDGIPLNEVVAA